MLQLFEDPPGRRHRDGEDDQGVRERLLVEGEPQEVGVAGIPVQNPNAQASVI